MRETASDPFVSAFELYQSRAAQTDGRYSAWLTDLNWACKIAIGTELYGPAKRIRKGYLEGLPPVAMLKRLQGIR